MASHSRRKNIKQQGRTEIMKKSAVVAEIATMPIVEKIYGETSNSSSLTGEY